MRRPYTPWLAALLAAVLSEAVKRAGIEPAEIDDVVVGTAMPEAEQG